MSDEIPEFMTELDEGSLQLHEMFNSMISQGFEQWQACFVIGVFIATMSMQSDKEDE